MIKFYVRRSEDGTILCSKILNSKDLVPFVLRSYLSSINCYPEIVLEGVDDDDEFWERMCFEKAMDYSEVLSD